MRSWGKIAVSPRFSLYQSLHYYKINELTLELFSRPYFPLYKNIQQYYIVIMTD